MSTHPEQALPNVVATAPERIYLVIGEDCPPDATFRECEEVTWCEDQIAANPIEYVRADVVAALTPQAPAEQPETATPEQSSAVGAAAALSDEDVWTAIDRFTAHASDFHGRTQVIALDDLRRVLPEAAEPVPAPVQPVAWREEAAQWLLRKAEAAQPEADKTGWANQAYHLPGTLRRLAAELDAEDQAAPFGLEPWQAPVVNKFGDALRPEWQRFAQAMHTHLLCLATPPVVSVERDAVLREVLRCRYPVDVQIRPNGFDWDIPRLNEVVAALAADREKQP